MQASFNEEDKKKAVFGIYPNRISVENGVNRLKAAGFLSSDISVLIPGVGPLIAAGPIVAALAGAGTGAAIGGLTCILGPEGDVEHTLADQLIKEVDWIVGTTVAESLRLGGVL